MLQACWYIVRIRLLTGLAYRFEVFTGVATNGILLIASVYLWKAAYGGSTQLNGMALHDLITYSMVAILLSSVYVCGVQNEIYSKVRDGQIATDFYRPIPLLLSYLANDLGGAFSSLITKVLPLLLVAALLFGFPAPHSGVGLLLFLPSCLLSYAILWLLSAMVGLLSFWVMELGNMGIVKDAIVRVLSGSMVPLWLFPEWAQTLSAYLPFQYTYQTPISIYIGQIGAGAAVRAMAVQAVWIGVLCLVTALFWRHTKKKTLIQGG